MRAVSHLGRPPASLCGWTRRCVPVRSRGFTARSSSGPAMRTAASGSATLESTITDVGASPVRAWVCVRPKRYALALATSGTISANVFVLHACDNPTYVKVGEPGALREHVVAGTQFDNTRHKTRRPARPRPSQRFGDWDAMRARPARRRRARRSERRVGRRYSRQCVARRRAAFVLRHIQGRGSFAVHD